MTPGACVQLIWSLGGSQGLYRIGEGVSGELRRSLTAASVSPVTGNLLLLGNFGGDDVQFGNFTLSRVRPWPCTPAPHPSDLG